MTLSDCHLLLTGFNQAFSLASTLEKICTYISIKNDTHHSICARGQSEWAILNALSVTPKGDLAIILEHTPG